MPTLVLDAYSKAYPFITNRIRASVALETSPLAPVATIIDSTAGHPIRIWHFPGLERNNYKFSLDEIDGSDLVVTNLALFDVVPSDIEGLLSRDDEQIQVGGTIGFTTGATSATFDGTAGAPDYRGWEIVPSELTGRGILVRDDLDYTWDKTTGVLTMLQAGDEFQFGNFWNIHFNPIQSHVGGSYPTLRDFTIILVTSTSNISNTSFGKKMIVEPEDPYIELTLPDIATVVEGRPLMVEVGGGSISTVKFIFGTPLNWLRGSLYAMEGESFSLYKFVRSGTPEWRVADACGNFINVGQQVDEDFTQVDVINKQLLDGSTKNKNQYARIYNELVLNLPLAQVVDYDDWATGNNKYLYSRANSADIGNADLFHFPDRRGLFERNNNVGKAGDFQEESIMILPDVRGVKVTSGNVTLAQPPDALNPTGLEFNLIESFPIVTPGATETRPTNVFKNRYVLL